MTKDVGGMVHSRKALFWGERKKKLTKPNPTLDKAELTFIT